MKTTEELSAEARTAHEAEAVRLEARFWQMLVVLAAIGGMLIGAGVVRCGLHSSADTMLITSAARVVQLEAEVGRMGVECAPPVLQALCEGDPLGPPCALSWERVLRERKFTWRFSSCGDRWTGRFDWTSVHDIDPANPVR